jgi:hypothetical protein
MQDERLPKLAIKYQPVEKQSKGHPKRSSWKRVEEYRINKPSQQLKENNLLICLI